MEPLSGRGHWWGRYPESDTGSTRNSRRKKRWEKAVVSFCFQKASHCAVNREWVADARLGADFREINDCLVDPSATYLPPTHESGRLLVGNSWRARAPTR